MAEFKHRLERSKGDHHSQASRTRTLGQHLCHLQREVGKLSALRVDRSLADELRCAFRTAVNETGNRGDNEYQRGKKCEQGCLACTYAKHTESE